MSELLPCPFCGGNAEIVCRDVEPQGDPYYGEKKETFVECQKCSCALFDGYFHEGFYEKDKAAEFWNRRVPSPAEKERDELRAEVASLMRWKSTLHKQVDDFANRYADEGKANAQLRAFAQQATKSLTSLAGGGSENFIRRPGDEIYLADVPYCEPKLRERISRLHKQIDDFAERYAQAAQEPKQLRVQLHAAESRLTTALAERDEALERAATKATSFLVGDPENGVPFRSPMPHEIADAIRKMKALS